MTEAEEQSWVVILRARAASRFKEEEKIRIDASAASTALVHHVELHNDYVGPLDDAMSHQGIRIDVSGRPTSLAEAAAILGGIGGAYANVIAVAGNAFVAEPRLSVVYMLPTQSGEGQFFQRTQVNEPTSPPAVVRTLPLAETGEFVNRITNHSEEDRLMRSCAHYADALRYWHEFEALRAAESLFIAAETLGPVILRRLLAEKGVTKEDLAMEFGFEPNPSGGTRHLYQLDAHLLRLFVFDSEASCFKTLKDVSHGFEHGFDDFDKIRRKAETVREEAARHIRKSILRESGLKEKAFLTLTSKPFDEVQGGWDPYLEIEGTLEPLGEPLPTDFIGMRNTAYIDAITETGDDHREISVKMKGDGSIIPGDLRVIVTKTQVWMPGTRYTKAGKMKSVFDIKRADGTEESGEAQNEEGS